MIGSGDKNMTTTLPGDTRSRFETTFGKLEAAREIVFRRPLSSSFVLTEIEKKTKAK
jgi:hypothetical protein